MTPLTKRKLTDQAVLGAISVALYVAGAGFWAFPLCLILACWNYYDGQTRDALREHRAAANGAAVHNKENT